MAIEVQRCNAVVVYVQGRGHVAACEDAPDGGLARWADVAPLLAELEALRAEVAELRERTRMRDAAIEPPPDGVPVLVQCLVDDDEPPAYVYEVCSWCSEQHQWLGLSMDRYWPILVQGWWPLPEVDA